MAIEIAISSVSDFGLTKIEDNVTYEERVKSAIKNLEGNRNTVGFEF